MTRRSANGIPPERLGSRGRVGILLPTRTAWAHLRARGYGPEVGPMENDLDGAALCTPSAGKFAWGAEVLDRLRRENSTKLAQLRAASTGGTAYPLEKLVAVPRIERGTRGL